MGTFRIARAATIVVVCILVFAASTPAQQVASIDVAQLRFLQKAQKIVAAVNKHDVDAIEADFDPVMKRELPADKLKPLLWQMTEELGSVEMLGDVRIKWKDVAIIPVKFQKGILDLQLAIDSADHISGLYFIPHKVEAPLPTRNSVKLSLPFSGRWNVVWGGDTKEQNFHHDSKNQRYAIDWNVTDQIGKSYNGEGKSDSDFFAWGKEVLSPADGIVTDAIDGVRDNDPFSANEHEALGNAIVIKIAENEYVVLSHLQRGSVSLKVGDKISRGQVIAKCGNSGNCVEPRLQMHLQNTPVMQDAYAIPMFFDEIGVQRKKDIEHIEKNYAPVRDEWVQNK